MKTAAPAAPAQQGTQAAPVSGPIKPEFLPVDLGGGNIEYVKRSVYAKRTAENMALKLKTEFKADHVTQALEAIDKGMRELDPGSNPEESIKLFNTVLEDYDAAVEKVKEDAQAAAQKKAEEERLENEKKERDEKLFAAVREKNPNLSHLAEMFDTGNMDRFIPKAEVSDDDLLAALNTGMKMDDFNGWMIGDLCVALEKRGLLNVVARLAEENGKPYSKIYNDCKTAKAIPPEQRRKGISFTIYREIANAKFTAEQQSKQVPALIEAVNEGKFNTQTVREEVRKIQGKTEPADVLPEDNEKKQFILIDPGLEPDKQVQISTGFPKELVGGGVTIIDPKTMKRFVGMKKKPEDRWEDVEAYEAPKPPEPEKPATPAPAAAAAKPAKKAAAAKK